MALGVNDILDFIQSWRGNNGLADDIKLSENQIEQFVMELHNQIEQMDFSVKEGTTIVGYSGVSNGKAAWEIATTELNRIFTNTSTIETQAEVRM